MQQEQSVIQQLASLPSEKRIRLWQSLRPQDRAAITYQWKLWARPSQLPPDGRWLVWLILAGRGWGKSRTGAEWVRMQIEQRNCRRVALIGRTAADVRDVMIEGQSGILAICPPGNRPEYEPSKRRITWPNGAIATAYSADEPDLLRGPQHDGFWADELAAWRRGEDAWDQLMLGLRLGARPRGVVTTTPRPVKLIRDLIKSPRTVVTRGSTYDNQSNLAPSFIQAILDKYEGTSLGRQELHAEVLDEIPGALWTRKMFEQCRVTAPGSLDRVVVAVDPATTSKDSSDETGIVVVASGPERTFYVLEDLTGRYTPDAWARVAVDAYERHKADRVVAEVNQGGDMVGTIIRQISPDIAYRAVHASRGKVARAEPIVALYEQGRVRHVGSFAALEDQCCSYVPGEGQPSPDRMDALVWGLTELSSTAPMVAAPSSGGDSRSRWRL